MLERHTFTLLGVATLLIEKSNIIDHNEKLQEKLDDLIDKIADDAEELNDITQQLRKSFPNEGLKLSCPL